MGMAASQARLLAITARIHDVEFQAQSIQNAKVQLATQSDQVYNEYLAALDATTLTVKQPNGNLITANFNNLCSRGKADLAQNYAIIDNKGRLIVEKDVYDAYKAYNGDKSGEAFAMFMCGGENGIGKATENGLSYQEGLNSAEEAVYEQVAKENPTSSIVNKHENVLNILNEIVKESNLKDAEGKPLQPKNIYDASIVEQGTPEQKKAYKEAMDSYRNTLYKSKGAEIYRNAMNITEKFDPETDFPWDDFNFYKDIFKQIEHYGGCVSIESFNGTLSGDAANNSEWLKSMVETGLFTIDTYKVDNSTGELKSSTTSPSSDTYLGYTATTSIDKEALAKAEAKYEHDLKQIDKKDKRFDLSLSKLETERTALTTEYDSVKKVIEDNIERTFGIFS